MPAPRPLVLVLLALGYAALSLIGQLLAAPELEVVSPVFPAGGLALAAVLSWGRPAAVAVAAGSVLANLVTFPDAAGGAVKGAAVLLIGMGAALGALVGAALWRPLAEPPLSRPRDVLRLGVAAVAGSGVSALVGASVVKYLGSGRGEPFVEIAATWLLGDGSGMVIVAPLLLVPRPPDGERARLAERGLLAALFLAVSATVFLPGPATEELFLAHLYLPLLAWAALRIGVRGTVDVAGATALAATVATALGKGPFVLADRTLGLLVVQTYLGTVSLTTLALGASTADRRRALAALEEARRALESRVEERTEELALAVRELGEEARSRAQAEAKLEAIVEHLPIDVFAVDLERRVVLQNAAARRDFGDLVGRRLAEAGLSPELLAQWQEEIAQALSGEVVSREASTGDGPGRRRYLNVLAPIRAEGELIGVAGASVDVTEYRRIQEALRTSEETYRSIFHGSNDAIYVHELETGATLDANREAERQSGRSLEELKGHHIREFGTGEPGFTAEDADRWHTKAREEGPQTFEWRGIAKDGSPRWVEVTLKRANIGGTERVLAVVRDIEERKRAEEERTRVATMLRLVLAHTPVVLYAVDREGVFRLTEGHGLARLGRAAGESVGMSVFSRYAGEAQLLDVARRALAGEEVAARVQLSNPPSVFDVHWTPRFDAAGRPDGALAVALDVTERARVEAERERLFAREQELRAKAEEAVRVRDDFLSVASHELRTPLTSLRFAVESLLHLARSPGLASAPGAFVEQALGAADRQAKRLTRLVDLLLDVSRIHEGRLELVTEETDLAALARQVAEGLEAEAAQARTRVTVRADGPVKLACDRLRIEQVLTNLLSNALKYGAGAPVEVRVEGTGELARVLVKDGGIGIAPEQQQVIFGRFERAVSVRHYGGLGLGLYIVKRIVEAHRGRVTVESAPGQGATFTVELPRAEGA